MTSVSVILIEIFCCGLIWSFISSLRAYSVRANLSEKLIFKSPKRKSYALGLYLYFRLRKLFQRHQFVTDQAQINHRHGSTFQTKSIGSTTLYTIEPRNTQAILASNFHAWGLEPTKLAALQAFCGHGLLTTDGERWARTRSIVTTFFRRAASIDLPAFDRILGEAFQRVPSNGDVVNLRPIFYDMVNSLPKNDFCPCSL